MKKDIIKGIVIGFIIGCFLNGCITKLEASNQGSSWQLGSTPHNPLYVKIVK